MTTKELELQDVKDWIYVAKRELLEEMKRVQDKLDVYGAWESNGMGKPKVGYPHGTDEWDREEIRKLRNYHYRLEGRWDMLDWILPSFLMGQPCSIEGKETLVSLNLAFE